MGLSAAKLGAGILLLERYVLNSSESDEILAAKEFRVGCSSFAGGVGLV